MLTGCQGRVQSADPFPQYCLKNKTHCLQTKNDTYNGQMKIMFIFSQLPFLELFAFIGRKTFLCFKSGDLIKPQVFLIFGAGGVGCECCPSLDWSLKAPACVHVCMSYTALCQVEFIRVQLNLFFFLSLLDETTLISAKDL